MRIEHHDAFRRGVEDGAEFLGVGVADLRRLGRGDLAATACGSARGLAQISACADSPSHEIACRWASVADGGACSARRLRGGNGDGRAGIRRAAGAGDAGLDQQRVEAAGLFERVQAVVSDAAEKRRVGVEQPVEPVDQHAGGNADRAASCRARSRRAAAAPAATASRAGRRPVRMLPRPAVRQSASGASDAAGVSAAAPVSFSSRAANCRASSLKALFSTGVSDGDFGSFTGRNGRTFLGVSIGMFQIGWV